MAEKKFKPVSGVVLLFVGIVLGVVLGIAGSYAVTNYNPPDATDDAEASATVVFNRIAERSELVSVSQDYVIVEKSGDSNRLFDIIEIPFTDNSFWYRYAGTIKAGVDMEAAEMSLQGNTIVVDLPAPIVVSNTPDMNATGVLEERNNVFNAIDVADVDALQRDCVARSEAEAVEGGLLDEARVETENNLRDIFQAALGEQYGVVVNWVDAS